MGIELEETPQTGREPESQPRPDELDAPGPLGPDNPPSERPTPLPDPEAPDRKRPVEVPGESRTWDAADVKEREATVPHEIPGASMGERRRRAQAWASTCTWARQGRYRL